MSIDLTTTGIDSKRVDVGECSMHYLEKGTGLPLVFVHGIPTWSYLWRNLIPTLSQQWRCIAPDLIGCGLSDKPDIDYTVFQHIDYFEQFINAMNLDKVVLVLHGWGSVIGFEFARRNPDKIKGLIFVESHVRANTDWSMLSLPIQEVAQEVLASEQGKSLILDSDYYLTQVFKPGILRSLTVEEWDNYCQPFNASGSKQVIWQYLQDLPLAEGNNNGVIDLIDGYSDFLQHSTIPKLMLYAVPGFITTIDTVQWAKNNMKDLTLVDIGDALHYPQESNPELMSEEINKWMQHAVMTGATN